MIILSGVLVVVAIALLIAGIVTGNSGTEVVGLDGLNLIYVSIGVSIVSALFLAIGVFLRRKDLFGPPGTSQTGPAAKTAKRGRRDKGKDKAAKTEPVTTGSAAQAGAAAPGQATAARTPDADTAELAATLPPAVDVPADAVVYVVPGRRRYHIDSCRHLTGREKEELTFGEAREEGFSPCTACMPDTALAARAVTGGLTTAKSRSPAEESTESATAERRETDLGAESAPAADRTRSPDDERDAAFGFNGSTGSAVPAGTGSAAEPSDVGDDKPAADEAAAHEKPSDETATSGGGEAKSAADPPPDESGAAAEIPQQAGAAAAGDDKARDAAGPQVRILSGTKRYHRPDCALIEDIGDDADDLESLTRAEAKARGCTPCLVCQPDKEPATRD